MCHMRRRIHVSYLYVSRRCSVIWGGGYMCPISMSVEDVVSYGEEDTCVLSLCQSKM
jgi:hypothetical protein